MLKYGKNNFVYCTILYYKNIMIYIYVYIYDIYVGRPNIINFAITSSYGWEMITSTKQCYNFFTVLGIMHRYLITVWDLMDMEYILNVNFIVVIYLSIMGK